MAKTIVLVACVSEKNRRCAAKDLYTSDWFCKASAYARRSGDAWYILSAKHGLLDPNAEIDPYNETLNTMPAASRRAWAQRVLRSLEPLLKPGDVVVLLAGTKYREHLIEPLQRRGCRVEVPMAGLRIGEQLSWLKAQIDR
ncbi:MAG TPA: hypothetical protein PLV53_09745 [Anaerolineaceae bacterium]|nr:hypothetical protein [Anaerolineaceae bacterium]